MQLHQAIILFLYFGSLGLLSFFGGHRFALMWLYWRHQKRAVEELPPLPLNLLEALPDGGFLLGRQIACGKPTQQLRLFVVKRC